MILVIGMEKKVSYIHEAERSRGVLGWYIQHHTTNTPSMNAIPTVIRQSAIIYQVTGDGMVVEDPLVLDEV